MIDRHVRHLVARRLADYPAVALLGPRQCGKTTFAQAMGGAYFDLEHQPDRLRLDLQWDDLIAGESLIILDEAQVWPEIFPRLRGAIDRHRARTGRFLLPGSVAPALMTQVSESLAGRLATVELTPLLRSEPESDAERKRHWLYGGYPEGGVLTPKRYPAWQLDYLRLLTQRDLPAWGLSARPQLIERLIRMLAAVHGQSWNASRIGQSLGINYQTVNRYVDYLEGAFLVRRLPPWLPNIRKRLVKSPKLYWRDSGLLHALMNVTDEQALLVQPWVGASWEGYVIEQIVGELAATGRPFTPYYIRTSDQHEIDLVIDLGSERWAIEVKLTSSPGPDDMRRLNDTADLIDASRRLLVSHVREPVESSGRFSGDLPAAVAHLLKAI